MNTIETIRANINANPALRPRTVAALAETQRLLAKELRYPADLRKTDYIASLEAHIVKLKAVLA